MAERWGVLSSAKQGKRHAPVRVHLCRPDSDAPACGIAKVTLAHFQRTRPQQEQACKKCWRIAEIERTIGREENRRLSARRAAMRYRHRNPGVDAENNRLRRERLKREKEQRNA